MTIRIFLALILTIGSASLMAGNLYSEFPDEVNPSDKYVFYSHGYIVEGTDPRPVSPRFGVYDFPAIKLALTDDDWHLVAYHRLADMPLETHVQQLVDSVNKLLKAGVKPANISLVGFSRGGVISLMADAQLKNKDINLALMASCFSNVISKPDLAIYGRVLSIYETSDRVGTCQSLVDQSQAVSAFKELRISTGKEHGAFFLPRPVWLEPLKAWLKQSALKESKTDE